MSEISEEKLIVGQISGVFGVKGWVKIFSHTDPRENIFSYSPWWVRFPSGPRKGEWHAVQLLDGKIQQGGKALVALLENVEDRDLAREYMGCEIAINRSQLENPAEEMYWIDLIGCQVKNQDGVILGEVTGLVETGAHDVLRVEGEYPDLIPFVMDEFILSVDISNKLICVNWELEEDQ